MEALRLHHVVEKDGEIRIRDLPCRKGQTLDLIVLFESDSQSLADAGGTAIDLAHSDIVGMWAHRSDLGDSSQFARTLRQTVEKRGGCA